MTNPDRPAGSDQWTFPEMDIFQEEEEGENELFSEEDDLEDDEENIEESPVKKIQEVNKKSEAEFQLEEKQLELDKKQDLLKSILSKVNEPLAFLDDKIINILQDIVKKIIVKIIYKEIHSDPELIKKMIQDLKSLISSHNGLINIYLSEEDYKRLQNTENENSQSIRIDKTLAEGDIVINTKDTEVRALLNDRIELLMGTLHE